MVNDNLKVDVSMNGVILHADKSERLVRVTQYLVNNRADAVIVRDGGAPIGIITRTDVIKAMAQENNDPRVLLAVAIMNQPLITIPHYESIVEAHNIMVRENVTKLPVVKELDIVGLLLKSDIIRDLKL
ncbi:cyclic nucleotide-binding/CBS domain-containing protein [Bacteroidota bacterium]